MIVQQPEEFTLQLWSFLKLTKGSSFSLLLFDNFLIVHFLTLTDLHLPIKYTKLKLNKLKLLYSFSCIHSK